MNTMKASKTMQIESVLQQIEDAACEIRKEVAQISDENLVLFQMWLADNELANITEFIESKAYDQSLEPETF